MILLKKRLHQGPADATQGHKVGTGRLERQLLLLCDEGGGKKPPGGVTLSLPFALKCRIRPDQTPVKRQAGADPKHHPQHQDHIEPDAAGERSFVEQLQP